MQKVLRLNLAGNPTAWLRKEDAAMLYAKDQVKWEFGDSSSILLGGTNRMGQQSTLTIRSVIATSGMVRGGIKTAFNNSMLFRRDHHMCMYCGNTFTRFDLTRDHVIPRSRGGKDIWENVVSACGRCNHFKADRTPDEAGMELLAVPFRPNLFEAMYLAQRTVLADQMEYLSKRFSGIRKWNAA